MVKGDENTQPLLGDEDTEKLGFLIFKPEGREPTEDEKKKEVRLVASKKFKIGVGPMPDAQSEPDISEKERAECWAVINDPKYKTIFDGHIGKMKNRNASFLNPTDQYLLNFIKS